MQNIVMVKSEELRKLVQHLFIVVGTSVRDADVISDSLVEANLTGVDSHGVVRVNAYIRRWLAGLINHHANLTWVRDIGGIAVLDADNGWGQSAAVAAMEKAVQKAITNGIGMVVVRNSNHIGACSYFTKWAAHEGCIGFASTNSSAMVAAWGTTQPTLGTNPLSIAVPTTESGDQQPVILDMATSEVARGKIIVAAKEKRKIPKNWALDKEGKPTTDPEAAMFGSLLPFGGVKGSGLSLMLDILTGVLSGANFGTQVGDLYSDDVQGIGHVFGAIHVSSFMEPASFYARMQERIRMTKEAVGPHDSRAVYMPGELESLHRENRLKYGIPLDINTYQDLQSLEKAYIGEISI